MVWKGVDDSVGRAVRCGGGETKSSSPRSNAPSTDLRFGGDLSPTMGRFDMEASATHSQPAHSGLPLCVPMVLLPATGPVGLAECWGTLGSKVRLAAQMSHLKAESCLGMYVHRYRVQGTLYDKGFFVADLPPKMNKEKRCWGWWWLLTFVRGRRIPS